MSDNIANLFGTESVPIIRFFQEPGLGFYIPLYQRKYSWGAEHITQLLEDICDGVSTLTTTSSDGDIRFLGTIIRVTERHKQINITPQEKNALPTRIDNIIDGQQRISTLALLAALLYQKLDRISKKLPENGISTELQDVIRIRLSELESVFAVNLQRGTPSLKPIVISAASEDTWTLNGSDDLYKSEVSNYLARVIRAIDDGRLEYPRLSTVEGNRVKRNLGVMNTCIEQVQNAHLPNGRNTDFDFPSAAAILSSPRIPEEDIWVYERKELKQSILGHEQDETLDGSTLCSLVQVLAFCHYLLKCCCFTVIHPTDEKWAYDMFQSLNATGTPLTAIETFKPNVVYRVSQNGEYKGSQEEDLLKKVDGLLERGTTAARKTSITNDLLTTFALAYNGKKLARRFSTQRQWLETQYKDRCSNHKDKLFLSQLSHVAVFIDRLNEFGSSKSPYLQGLSHDSADSNILATFCLLYLKEANHRMARTILSLFYSQVLNGVPESTVRFVEATKAITAFYTLWRSATSNAGLDNAYRTVLAGKEDDSISIPALSWARDESGQNLSLCNLKSSLRELLLKRIENYERWKSGAMNNLNYEDAMVICRFALFITSKDIIADENTTGLMTEGRAGATDDYWVPDMWSNKSLLSVEHIAPKKRGTNSDWEVDLYVDRDIHKIGNLTLLTSNVNQSLGNKPWKTKWIYYRHLVEKDPSKHDLLRDEAQRYEIRLQQSTLDLLRQTPVTSHIEPIVTVGIEGNWNKDLVHRRTERLCHILWKRLFAWLE